MSGKAVPTFHPVLQRWFSAAVGRPTDIQERAWPVIAAGNHVLITAPTGSGKTLAAFLWSLNQLLTGVWPRGRLRVLYVSPLKALNNDVRRNLLEPLRGLDEAFRAAGEAVPQIAVLTRSGDTPGEERRRMARRPPEILITTPESFNLLLSSHSGRSMLTGIRTVILDEIHAVVGTKRGTHLITAVDRLVPLSGEFQRIALSATVNPLEGVAAFVGGFRRTGRGADSLYEKRQVSIIRSRAAKAFELSVVFPPQIGEQTPDGLWRSLTAEWKKIVAAHGSTLFFTNSRRHAEKVTRFLNEGEEEEAAYAHHGSLSREIRLAVEEKLKRGELRAIVATNSLELGIDIGSLDRVVLIQTPRSVSSVLQRIGRSGHGVVGTSRGTLFPTHGMDIVDAAVMARAVTEQDIEEIRPVDAPLDILAQVVLSMTAMERWDIDELFAELRASYPFRELPRRHFDLVLDMLAGRYADTRLRELTARVLLDRLDNTVQAKSGSTFVLYSSGGTIPERGYFDLRLAGSRAKIGELDEEFVWERSVGETFTLGSQLWRIEAIGHNDVEVTPAQSATGIFPFWRAEEQNRDFHLSERIGLFLKDIDARLDSPELKALLRESYALDETAAGELLRFLLRQRDATGERLPHRSHLLAERIEDPVSGAEMKQLVLHTLWGGKVNRPFGLALAAAWGERFAAPLQVISSDDALLLMLPHDIALPELLSLVTPENVEALLRKTLEGTGYFGARFRENAERALLLPKAGFRQRMPLWLIRLRAKKLYEAVRRAGDFPILIETWRTCLKDEFDLDSLSEMLEELRDGRIAVSECTTRAASPFAAGLAWKRTNAFMYDDDTPSPAGGTALKPDLLREILFQSHLRPRVPQEVIEALDRKLKRTAPGYAPQSSEELLDWVRERLLIPETEWRELAEALRRDADADGASWLAESAAKLAWIGWAGASGRFLASIEALPRVLRAFGLRPDDAALQPVAPDMPAEELRGTVQAYLARGPRGDEGEGEFGLPEFLSSWLAYYGPVERRRLQAFFGLADDRFDAALEPLIESQGIVADRFGEESALPELCDSGNLEMLLRMARRYRRPDVEALPLGMLPLFLASFQGVAVRGESMDDLQQRLEQLFGWPAPAEAWERSLLPSRMRPYRGEWLDRLMRENDLLWLGCGPRRITLSFFDDLPLFRERDGGGTDGGPLERLLPDRLGRFSLLEISERAGMDSSAAAGLLWEEAWRGQVTTDSFLPVRKGILTGFAVPSAADQDRPLSRRSGFNRWKASRPLEGQWRRIDAAGTGGAGDVIAEAELAKDRVRQLLRRYGVLFRELASNELPLLQWRQVFRSLRLMELSGEVLSGRFFEGIPGLQFALPEAYRMLREPLPEDALFRINAADPASLCGIALEGLKPGLPPRQGSTDLVYCGSTLAIIVRRSGRSLDIRIGEGDPRLRACLGLIAEALTREFDPPAKILVEEINGAPALASSYAAVFREAGFRQARTGLELWRSYA